MRRRQGRRKGCEEDEEWEEGQVKEEESRSMKRRRGS